jgi:HEAT repeat protein
MKPGELGSETELDRHLGFLLSPFGDAPSCRQREQSLQYLLAHAEQAHPRLLDLLEGNPAALQAPAILEALPRFGRAESVPMLERLLVRGEELVSRAAGRALGLHPAPEALAALLRGLRSPLPETVIAAADGLLVRRDRAAGEPLLGLMGHPDPVVRYHVLQAAGGLGGLSPAELDRLQVRETDADVRGLLARLRTAAAG